MPGEIAALVLSKMQTARRVEIRRVQGWLGVRTLSAVRYATGRRPGVIVLSVAAGSPAAEAGLRPTDILYAIEDCVLRRSADIVAALAEREPGSLVRLHFQRAGEWLERVIPVRPSPPARIMPGRD